mmetsp:Transcript_19115/g.29895  ORF Transcript_19115/g.29895 Transcript_19115/m.29895 type:complete len:400 (+) Transcript_19115:177-1376(+)|eukprot:CAMPEP_0184297542 /NCGR_PEP_ID=MMETSP1049-20130417/8449_1 /TAXON_ID=77928 /ORGANISM="Proteomonas sulcata, Strain CCMP704" /LENGTH=399 /DNA_ID=CAMNT_0026607317 /DNA_START=101 /DNA_END=1300 /DNA_ORIENTATION=+
MAGVTSLAFFALFLSLAAMTAGSELLSDECIASLPKYGEEQCFERCEGCTGVAAMDCISCKPGFVLDVQFDDCVGRCVDVAAGEPLFSPYSTRHQCNTWETETSAWQCARDAMIMHPNYAHGVDFTQYDHDYHPEHHPDEWDQYDQSDHDKDEDDFETLFGVNGNKCFHQKINVDLSVCGKDSMRMGVCANSETEANQGFTMANLLMTFIRGVIDDAAKEDCKEMNAQICGSIDKVKTNNCNGFCEAAMFQVEHGVVKGCHTDQECPLTGDPLSNMPPMCCSYMRSVWEEVCHFDQTELDIMIQQARMPELEGPEGTCSEAPDCIHPGKGPKRHRRGGGMPKWAIALLAIFGVGCAIGLAALGFIVVKRRAAGAPISIYSTSGQPEGALLEGKPQEAQP